MRRHCDGDVLAAKCKRCVSTDWIDSFPISAPMPASVESSSSSQEREPRRIWDGVGQSFNTGHLRAAMLARGLTAEALADAAGVSRGTSYNALHGKPVRLRTARLLLEALANVQPTLDVGFALTDG